MDTKPSDYVEDWCNYWEFKSDQRERNQIENAAQNPEKYYLVVDVDHLSPEPDGYDWNIELEDLRLYPDSVLEDCRKGFAEFVEESDIADPRGENYDILPVHLKNYDGYYLASSLGKLRDSPNILTQFSASFSGPLKRKYRTTSVTYCCPSGHHTRIVEPIYQANTVEVCGESGCKNSVFPISSGTTAREVVEFKVTHQDRTMSQQESIDCVTTGLHAKDRNISNLAEADRIRLTGILRNVLIEGGEVNPVFETLFLDDSLR